MWTLCALFKIFAFLDITAGTLSLVLNLNKYSVYEPLSMSLWTVWRLLQIVFPASVILLGFRLYGRESPSESEVRTVAVVHNQVQMDMFPVYQTKMNLFVVHCLIAIVVFPTFVTIIVLPPILIAMFIQYNETTVQEVRSGQLLLEIRTRGNDVSVRIRDAYAHAGGHADEAAYQRDGVAVGVAAYGVEGALPADFAG